jgi:RNA polymerase sigma factor (sigma-70 family)
LRKQRRIWSEDQVNDACQEVLLQLKASFHRLASDEAWLNYVRQISMRVVAGLTTKNVRDWADCRQLIDELRSPRVPAVEQIDLAACLAQISVRQKEAIILRHLYGYSLDEISKELRCTPRTVRRELLEGLQKMRAFVARCKAPQSAPDDPRRRKSASATKTKSTEVASGEARR